MTHSKSLNFSSLFCYDETTRAAADSYFHRHGRSSTATKYGAMGIITPLFLDALKNDYHESLRELIECANNPLMGQPPRSIHQTVSGPDAAGGFRSSKRKTQSDSSATRPESERPYLFGRPFDGLKKKRSWLG